MIRIVLKKIKRVHKNNLLISQTQQRFRSEKHLFTEEIKRIALSLDHDKRTQSSDSIETYAHGTSKELACKKKEIKYNNLNK